MNNILLEKLLQFTEDTVFLSRLAEERFGNSEVLPSPSDLRNSLLKHDDEASLKFITALSNYSGFQKEILAHSFMEYSLDISAWYFGSKRIFNVSSNLMELLLETNLPDFVQSEIHFVAESFAIKLEKPISLGEYGHLYDFLVCCRQPSSGILSVRAYPMELYEYKALDPVARKKISKMSKQHGSRFRNTYNNFVGMIEEVGHGLGFIISPETPDSTQSYREIIEAESTEENREDFLKIFQIALGTNLYVQAERKCDSDEIHTKVSARRSNRGLNITSNADIFTLTTSYVVNRSPAHESSDPTGKDVRPHFRRGFWRRPKGYGQDPNAKATEWVRPTWVRLDKIESGSMPLGSIQKTTNTQECLHEA